MNLLVFAALTDIHDPRSGQVFWLRARAVSSRMTVLP